MNSNAVRLLTPPGAAAIAVVRCTGPLVDSLLAARFSKPAPLGKCVHGQWGEIDDPVVVRVSDTAVDVNLHGGPYVVRAFTEDVLSFGFIRWSPDPATTIEDEIAAAIPFARTEAAVRALLSQPAAWADLLEHPDDNSIAALLSDHSGNWLVAPPTIAIVGPPNVGKSTLANRLFGQDRCITADTPGTTRDWVGEWAEIDGLAVRLFDTPGLRDTDDPIEREAIRLGLQQASKADLLIAVTDARTPMPPLPSIRRIDVVNKIDVVAPSSEDPALPTIATTGQGVDRVRQAIAARFDWIDDPTKIRVWTDRQRDVVRQLGGTRTDPI